MVGLAIVTLVLAACGGDASTVEVTPASVAEDADCTDFATSETNELGVSEGGKCERNGAQITINTFSNNEARDTWVRLARTVGGPYFVGDRFVAYSHKNPQATASLSDSLEGELVR